MPNLAPEGDGMTQLPLVWHCLGMGIYMHMHKEKTKKEKKKVSVVDGI